MIGGCFPVTGAGRLSSGTLRGLAPMKPLVLTLLCFACWPVIAPAQVQLQTSSPRLFGTDMAVLEAGEVRGDLPCTVNPVKPVLGFDLKFHGGFEVSVPLKELAGSENLLTILFRVSPKDNRNSTTYFTQKIRVPSIEETAKGDAYLQGYFDLGEGAYHVDWLMRDRAERVCSFFWDADAILAQREKDIAMRLAAGGVEGVEVEPFRDEPPVERAPAEPLNIKVLVNFAPQNPSAAALKYTDTSALVSILRNLARHPNIGRFSVVAFSMQEQRVIYRQNGADKIDFPALGKAVGSVNLGTVHVNQLATKNGDTEFLSELIRNEISPNERPDAVVFAGPKVMLDENPSKEALASSVTAVDYPVFYMNYNLNPQAIPWQDSIGRAVKFFRGTEYTISRPRELWNAVSEMVARIVKSKQARQSAAGFRDGSN